VDAPIDRHPTFDTARRIAESGKPAQTDFIVVSANPDYDLRKAVALGNSSSNSSSSGSDDE